MCGWCVENYCRQAPLIPEARNCSRRGEWKMSATLPIILQVGSVKLDTRSVENTSEQLNNDGGRGE